MNRNALLASVFSAALITPATAFAQDTVDTVSEADSSIIIVTGTRRTDRTLADSPVPIDVISGEALVNTGYTETNRILNQLVPSFNFPQPSLTDGTDSLRPATLRGLAPDQVLVLVNGKRRHTSSLINLNGSVGRGSVSVDLNTIPPLAIERIEVLRDGASSNYGSDAIAGVINIQLRRSVGGRAQATFGRYITDMKDVPQVTGVVTGADGLPIVLTPGNTANDVLQLSTNGRDRHIEDGDTWTVATNIGLPVGDRGYLNFTAELKDRDSTNRTGADPRRQYATVGDPRELTINRYTHRYGDGESQDMNFFANAGVELGAFELYGFGSYGIRDGNGAGFYRRANDARNRDWSASTTSFVPIYANGFLPLIVSEIQDISAAAGLRGELSGWNTDLSVVYGSNRLNYNIEDTVNTSLGGLASNRRFYAGGLRFGQTVVNLDAQRSIPVSFLSELSVAIGAEYRNENFKIVQGELQSYINGPFSAAPFSAAGGSQVFPGFRPNNEVDESRDSFAAYVEFDADVSDRLSFQIAGRYEHYSDFGSTVNGKIAGRFEPITGVAVRGSISTGFRAPSLHQQFFTATSTNNIGGTLIEVGTFPVTDPVSVALGAQELDPEKSLNLGAGIALTPISGLSLTADYYNIRIDDRIVLSENLQGNAVVALLQAAGINNITSARFFTNGIDTRTQGIDIVGTYRMPDHGFGRLVFTAGFNYNKTTITDRAVLPTLPGLTLFARPESLRLTNGQPRNKVNLGLDWDYGPIGFTARTNRYGRVLIPGADSNIAIPIGGSATDITLSPKWISDVELRARPFGEGRGIELAIGANNVFDVYPDRLPAGGVFGLNSFFLPYSSFSPFGFNGRFVYARASIEF